MMMMVVVVTNCVTDGVSGGVDDMKMIGMLVVVMTIEMSIISISISIVYQYITSMSVNI